MAFATKQSVLGIHNVPTNCGGLNRAGAGVGGIVGVAKLSGAPAICRVSLYSADGVLRGFRRTGTDGAYTFIGLPAGEYRIVVEDDRQTLTRAKVEHVIVEASAPLAPLTYDPFFTNVTSLVHFGGADGDITFPDQIGAAWTRGGNAQIDTTYGTPAGLFDGGDGSGVDKIQKVVGALGNGDFTIEAYIRPSLIVPAYQTIAMSATAGVGIYLDGTGRFVWYYGSPMVPSYPLTAGQEYHVVAERWRGTLRTYVDGIEAARLAGMVDNLTDTTTYIGLNNIGSEPFNGHIREYRRTVGVARYKGVEFTPPATLFDA